MLLPIVEGQTTTGTISGVVLDPAGSSIPEAKVTAVNEANSATRTATTNAAGVFDFFAMDPATYTVTIERAGFQTYRRTGEVLIANQRLALGEIHLTVGSMTETISVTAEAPALQTDSSENSAVLTDRQMAMMQARGRDVTDLLRLLPGVSQGQSVEALGGSGGPPGTVAPNISGARAGALDFTVDGVAGNDMGTASALSSAINMDAIGEVNVLLTNYQAEYGRNNGAIVAIVSKSGTSELHGTGYWYKRHEMFNATDFFVNKSGLPKTVYRFTTLGFTVGGPVYIPGVFTKKNKVFFFQSYENQASKFPYQFQEFTMPTALERQGNFSQSTLVPKDPTNGAPFPGNIIPPSRINSSTQALMNVFPLPNISLSQTGGAYNYVFQGDYDIPKWSEVFKVDFPVSAKDSFYARGNDYKSDTKAYYTGAVTNPAWPWFVQHYIFPDGSVALHWTHIFSNTIVNEAMTSLRHSAEDAPPVSWSAFDQVATRTAVGYTAGQFYPQNNAYNMVPQITSLGGVTNAPTLTYDTRFVDHAGDTTFQVEDGLTVTRGTHVFKFGGYWWYGREPESKRATFAGAFDFSNTGANPNNAVNPYANMLLGGFNTYTESTNLAGIEGRMQDLAFYAQDTWKVTKRFTLDYGLRLSRSVPVYEACVHFLYAGGGDPNCAAEFVPADYSRANAPRQYVPEILNGVRVGVDPATGQTVPAAGIGAFVPNTGSTFNGAVTQITAGVPKGFFNQPGPKPMPRIGFAWDPWGNGKTSVRGGFGLFYQTHTDGNIFGSEASTPPNQYNSVEYYGNVSTLLSSRLLAPSNGFGVDPSTIEPSNWNTSIGIQRDIGFGTVLDVKYVSNFGRHLYSERNLNLLPFGERFLPSSADSTTGGYLPDSLLRPYPGWGNLTYFAPNANSSYNGLQVAVNHRMSHNLMVSIAYSWSKSLDITDSDLSIGTPTYLPMRRNWDVSGFDQTHIFVVNYTYNIPIAASFKANRAANAVFADWQLSGVTTFASGFPVSPTFSVSNGEDLIGGGDPQRMNVTCNPEQPWGSRTATQFFNTSCFALPSSGQIGDASRNPIRAPGINNFDATLFRTFHPFKNERREIVMRWEAYNVFNHTQFGGSPAGIGGSAATGLNLTAIFLPNGTLENNGFGSANSAKPPRIMQVSLRINF